MIFNQIAPMQSGGTIVSKTITANGTYDAGSDNADGYSPVVVNVPTGGSSGGSMSDPIRFFDYDGAIVSSYTSVPSELPPNPSHSGLVAQGWNYTLAQIQTQFAATGTCDIGQMYITESGDTEIDVSMVEGRLSPYLSLAPNGTVTIDWGDGSAVKTVTGTSLNTRKNTQHTYATAGDYTIKIHVSSGKVSLYCTSAYTLLNKNHTTANMNRVYSNCVRAVRLGANIVIGYYAFYNCYSLTAVTIPDSVTSIGSDAFNGCYSLAAITIPDSVTSIVDSMFASCYSLAAIAIPDGVTSIGSSAFNGCHSLSAITIPDGVTSIGSSAFSNCWISAITIPDGVTSIGNNTFYNCSLVAFTIPDGVTSIGSSAFYNCSSLAAIAIPDGVTSIGNYAFSGCLSLASVTIPDGVTSIGNNTFNGCLSLASVTIPDSVTSIGDSAFYGCHSLAAITIPDGVTSIGSSAFYNCQGLGEIHFNGATPPSVSNKNAWTNVPNDCKIYVPSGSLSAYTSASNYPSSSTYTYIEE